MWQMLLSSPSVIKAIVGPAFLLRAFTTPSTALTGPAFALRCLASPTTSKVGPAIMLRAFKE